MLIRQRSVATNRPIPDASTDASTEGEAVIQARCAAVCIDEVRLPCTLGLSVIYGLLNTQHLRAHYSYIYIIE